MATRVGLAGSTSATRRVCDRGGLSGDDHWFHLSAVFFPWPELFARTLVTSGGVSAAKISDS